MLAKNVSAEKDYHTVFKQDDTSPDGVETPPPAPPPPAPCSSYNDESGCNSGNNCYYVKNIDDVSDSTTDKFNECINKDEKCIGRYKSSCSATFEPTNRFKECCYDTIFDGLNCIKSEYESENQSVNNYSQDSYIAAKGYCSEIYERKDIEDGISA